MDQIKQDKINKATIALAEKMLPPEWAAEAGIHIPSAAEKVLESFLTLDPELMELKKKIVKLASSDLPILIIGETGTGKELIAKALHGNRHGQFIAVNTAGIPDTLLESEFFGAERGAYTGCDRSRDGYLKVAHKGTLFLDEIGDMPMLLQSKLLRVLQDKRARALGSTVEYEVNCRFVSATNHKDIKTALRPDILYRLAGYIIELKPLRDRGWKDISLIFKHNNFDYSDEEFMKLKEKDWLGNVRELLNYIEAQKCLKEKNSI